MNRIENDAYSPANRDETFYRYVRYWENTSPLSQVDGKYSSNVCKHKMEMEVHV